MTHKSEEELALMLSLCPADNSRWTHKVSGKQYRVHGQIIIEAALVPGVIYGMDYSRILWVRPLAEFMEKFEEVKE